MQKQVKIHLTTEMNRKVKEQSPKPKATVMVLSLHWLTSALYFLLFLPCSDFFHSTLISHASHLSTLHSSLNFFHMCCLNIYRDASSCLLPVQLSEHAQNMQSLSLCSDVDDFSTLCPVLLGFAALLDPGFLLVSPSLAFSGL